jgi:hypothetical protein
MLVLWATTSAGYRAELVESGIPIAPMRLGRMLLVDVDADPAKAVWLGDLEQRPALLSDPWLLYLGQSDKSIVFVACGQTLVLPADQVSAVVLTTQAAAAYTRGTPEGRAAFCQRPENR